MSDSEKPQEPTGPWIARHPFGLAAGLGIGAAVLIPVSLIAADVIIPRIAAQPDTALQWQARVLRAAAMVSPVLVLLKVVVIAGCLLVGVWLASIPPALLQRELSPKIAAACAANLAELTRGLHDYVADSNGTLPRAGTWCDDLKPYVESEAVFVCPAAPKLRCGYAYNAALSGLRYDAIEDADAIVAFFESDAGWNAAGGPELLARKPRHAYGDSDIYAWVGGWVELRLRRDASGLEWRPVLKERPEHAPTRP